MDKKEIITIVMRIVEDAAANGKINEVTARGLIGETLERNREALIRAAVPSFTLAVADAT